MLRFIEGKSALLAGSALVLADIHIGIEHELFEKGVRLESPMKGMLEEVLGMIQEHSPELVVLLGDVKHNIPQMPPEELRDLREFAGGISESAPVVIVPGNHDGGIGNFLGLERVRVAHASGFIHQEFGFFHGHSWPSKEVMGQETVLMAHQHPLVELADKVGGKHLLKAWCVGELGQHERYPDAGVEKAVILPAFNPLAGGAVLNRRPAEGLHGPVMKNMFKLAKSEIYLLDGTPLGRVEMLAGGKTKA